jgi:predicted nuclease with TOPRIM domain
VSDRILYVPTVPSEHGNRTEMELDMMAEPASLRARLAEAEAERDAMGNNAERFRQSMYAVEEKYRQAREELAALRAVAEAAKRWGAAYRERTRFNGERTEETRDELLQSSDALLSKLSALPGAIESAPAPPEPSREGSERDEQGETG